VKSTLTADVRQESIPGKPEQIERESGRSLAAEPAFRQLLGMAKSAYTALIKRVGNWWIGRMLEGPPILVMLKSLWPCEAAGALACRMVPGFLHSIIWPE
jgi:hypothetical protein